MSNQTKTGEKAKRTPGPLYVVDVTSREPGKADRRHFDVFAQTGPYLHTATCEKEADATLYAAAPDLLEACKAALAKLEVTDNEHCRAGVMLEAAIQKATGGAA